MPRFFFDVHDGVSISDTIGEDHPNIDSARTRAMQLAGGYTGHPKMLREDGGAIVMEVRDSSGLVSTIRLAFTVTNT